MQSSATSKVNVESDAPDASRKVALSKAQGSFDYSLDEGIVTDIHKISSSQLHAVMCHVGGQSHPYINLTEDSLVHVLECDSPYWWIVQQSGALPSSLFSSTEMNEEDTSKTQTISEEQSVEPMVENICDLPSKSGFVSSSCIAVKSRSLEKRKRDTREVFREDIIKITNKQQETQVKRRYALTELKDTELEYCRSLPAVVDLLSRLSQLSDNDVMNHIGVMQSLLLKITELHEKSVLPQLSSYSMDPAGCVETFLSLRSQFLVYVDYMDHLDFVRPYMEYNKESSFQFPGSAIPTTSATSFSATSSSDSSGSTKRPHPASIGSMSGKEFLDFLLRPLNRLHAYRNLLRDIMRYTARIPQPITRLQEGLNMLNYIKRKASEDKWWNAVDVPLEERNQMLRLTNVRYNIIPNSEEAFEEGTLVCTVELLFFIHDNVMNEVKTCHMKWPLRQVKWSMNHAHVATGEWTLYLTRDSSTGQEHITKAVTILFPSDLSRFAWEEELKRIASSSDKDTNYSCEVGDAAVEDYKANSHPGTVCTISTATDLSDMLLSLDMMEDEEIYAQTDQGILSIAAQFTQLVNHQYPIDEQHEPSVDSSISCSENPHLFYQLPLENIFDPEKLIQVAPDRTSSMQNGIHQDDISKIILLNGSNSAEDPECDFILKDSNMDVLKNGNDSMVSLKSGNDITSEDNSNGSVRDYDENVVFHLGSPLVLTVKLPQPDTKVTWEHNGIPISIDDQSFHIFDDGNEAAAHIEKDSCSLEDEGNFICRFLDDKITLRKVTFLVQVTDSVHSNNSTKDLVNGESHNAYQPPTPANLDTQPPLPVETSWLLCCVSEMEVIEGTSMFVECILDNHHKDSVEDVLWLCNGQPLKNKRENILWQKVGNKLQIHIDKISSEFEGQLVCRVSLENGEIAERGIRVRVKTRSSHVEQNHRNNVVPNDLLELETDTLDAVEGEDFMICVRYPSDWPSLDKVQESQGIVEWCFEDEPLPLEDSNHYTAIWKNNFCYLLVLSATTEDSGFYSLMYHSKDKSYIIAGPEVDVIVRRRETEVDYLDMNGDVDSHLASVAEEDEGSESSWQLLGENHGSSADPVKSEEKESIAQGTLVLHKPLKDTAAAIGQCIKLEAIIESNVDDNKIQWSVNGEKVTGVSSHFIPWQCGDSYMLTIPSLDASKMGEYHLRVSTVEGSKSVETQCRVTLIDDNLFNQASSPFSKSHTNTISQETSKSVRSKLDSISTGLEPMITKRFSDQEVDDGETVTFLCRVMGIPEPQIKWRWGQNDLLESESVHMYRDLNNYTLVIRYISTEQAGEYTFLAWNDLGQAECSARINVDGFDHPPSQLNDESSLNAESLIIPANIRVPPRDAPLLDIKESNTQRIILEWHPIKEADVSYVVEMSTDGGYWWKTIAQDLFECQYVVSSSSADPLKSFQFRVLAENDFGLGTPSKSVVVKPRAAIPQMPLVKPVLQNINGTCIELSWSPATLTDVTLKDSLSNKFTYSVEMKQGYHGGWSVIAKNIVERTLRYEIKPGVAYQFRIKASNSYGESDYTPSVMARVDINELLPEFSLDAPWAQVRGSNAVQISWKPAYLPEMRSNSIRDMQPVYKVEYRVGRGAWTVLNDSLFDCTCLVADINFNDPYEFRVYCTNAFGSSGPTKNLKLSQNTAILRRQRSTSTQNSQKTSVHNVKEDKVLEASIVSIHNEGVDLSWTPFDRRLIESSNVSLPVEMENTEHKKYSIERQNILAGQWDVVVATVYGESYCLEFRPAEFDESFRILYISQTGDSVDAYKRIVVPKRQSLIPDRPENVKVVENEHEHHVITWNSSAVHPLLHKDNQVTYLIECQLGMTNGWQNIGKSVTLTHFTNSTCIEGGCEMAYRVIATNCLGSSPPSKSTTIATKLTPKMFERLIDKVFYRLLGPHCVRLSWRLTEEAYNLLNTSELSYKIQKREDYDSWRECCSAPVEVGTCDIEECIVDCEITVRVVPIWRGQPCSPSRPCRLYAKLESLVPDMSFVKPSVEIPATLEAYHLLWEEPLLEESYSSHVLQFTPPEALLADLSYFVEISKKFAECNKSRRTKMLNNSSSNSFTLKLRPGEWTTLVSDLQDTNYLWTDPDPLEEYEMRVRARNQFGIGPSSRILKIDSQIVIPDLSYIRPTIKNPAPRNSLRKLRLLSNDFSLEEDSPTRTPPLECLEDESTELCWYVPRNTDLNGCYIPITFTVQYCPADGIMLSSQIEADQWITLREQVKKPRLYLTDLDPDREWYLRVMAVSQYGTGEPSQSVKVLRQTGARRTAQSSRCSSVMPLESLEKDVAFINGDDEECVVRLGGSLQLKCALKGGNLYGEELLVDWDMKHMLESSSRPCSPPKFRQIKDILSGTFSLTSHECLVEEGGIYSCKVTRKSASATKKFTVFVQDPPIIEDAPRDQFIDVNGNLMVTCTVHYDLKHLSNDEMKVLWFKDWKSLTNTQRTKLTVTSTAGVSDVTNQHIITLSIERCLVSDAGMYSIQVVTRSGQCQTSFALNIAEDAEKSLAKLRKTEFDRFYVKLSQLSKGRFSNVHRVIERSTGNEMVAKIYSLELPPHRLVALTEFECLRLLHHHSVPHLYDAVVSDTEFALTMESVNGEPLLDHVIKLKDVDDRLLADLFHQLCEAVCHLHSKNVVHLDLQPDNILVINKRHICAQVKIIGFSAAVVSQCNRGTPARIWNPEFSAPEIIGKQDVALESDMWTVGIIASILLSGGIHPFITPENNLVEYSVTEDQISEWNSSRSLPEVCENTRRFVKDCLCFSSEERLKSLDAVKHEWFTRHEEETGSISISQNHLESYTKQYRERAMYMENVEDQSDVISSIDDSLSSMSSSMFLEKDLSNSDIHASLVKVNGNTNETEEEVTETTSIVDDLRHVSCMVHDAWIEDTQLEEVHYDGLAFQRPLKNGSFQVGEDIQLTCQLAPHPETVTVLWYRSRDLLTNGERIHIETLPGSTFTLTLRKASPHDGGVFRCVARSKSSMTQTEARLDSKDTPQQPGRPFVLQCGSTEALLCWSYRGNELDEIFFRVDVLWLHESSDNYEDWQIAAYCIDSRCLVTDLQPDQHYRFRVCARNSNDIGDYSVVSSTVYTHSTKSLIMDSEEHNYFIQRQGFTFTDALDKRDSLQLKSCGQEELSEEEIQMNYHKTKDLSPKVSLLSCKSPSSGQPLHIVLKLIPEEDEHELEALEQLKSVQVTHLLGSFLQNNNICLALEYVSGGNLLPTLRHRESYSEYLVSEVAKQLLQALLYIHIQGFVHGAVTVENILVANWSFSIPNIKLCCFHSTSYFKDKQTRETSETTVDLRNVARVMFHLLTGEAYQENGVDINMALRHCSKYGRHFIQYSLSDDQQRGKVLHEKQLLKHKWFSLETGNLQDRLSITLLSERLVLKPPV